MRTPIVQRRQRARRSGLVAMGLTALLGCAWLGCSAEGPERSARGSEGLVADRALDRPALATQAFGDRRLPWTPGSDLELIDYLVVHHRQAIRMADAVLARGAHPGVRALASVMRDVRSDQLDTLLGARAALAGSVDVTDVPYDPHLDHALATMAKLSGGPLDRMFLVEMIGHDAAAIGPVLRAEANLQRPELQTMADALFDGQSVEVAEMSLMLGDDSLASVHRVSEGGLGPFGDPRVPFTPANDLQVVDYFLSRHLEAIAMADIVLAYGADPDVHAFAMGMKATMTKEMEELRAVRFALTGRAEWPTPPEDHRVDTILKVMRTLAGAPLDRIFIDELLPHHADGTAPAQRALEQVERTDLRGVVVQIFETHAKEIGELESLRQARASIFGGK